MLSCGGVGIWKVLRVLMAWGQETIFESVSLCVNALEPTARWHKCDEVITDKMFKVLCTLKQIQIFCSFKIHLVVALHLSRYYTDVGKVPHTTPISKDSNSLANTLEQLL